MKDNKSRSTCLLGGDPEYCEDCIYGVDYHYVDGECVERALNSSIKYIAKDLCDKSGCHHKCNDTKDCVVEDEAKEVIANSATTTEKQIEEMVKTISTCERNCLNCKVCYWWELCEALYNAGYRKQVVMTTHLTMEDQKYKPTCKYGYEDCVWDPAYIKYHHTDWYDRLFGDISPEEALLIPGHSCMSCADDNFLYDDEDK